MKYYINYFKDFGLSIYPINKFRNGFDLVLICITISIDYGEQDKGQNTQA